jgi:hypothetical protein
MFHVEHSRAPPTPAPRRRGTSRGSSAGRTARPHRSAPTGLWDDPSRFVTDPRPAPGVWGRSQSSPDHLRAQGCGDDPGHPPTRPAPTRGAGRIPVIPRPDPRPPGVREGSRSSPDQTRAYQGCGDVPGHPQPERRLRATRLAPGLEPNQGGCEGSRSPRGQLRYRARGGDSGGEGPVPRPLRGRMSITRGEIGRPLRPGRESVPRGTSLSLNPSSLWQSGAVLRSERQYPTRGRRTNGRGAGRELAGRSPGGGPGGGDQARHVRPIDDVGMPGHRAALVDVVH